MTTTTTTKLTLSKLAVGTTFDAMQGSKMVTLQKVDSQIGQMVSVCNPATGIVKFCGANLRVFNVK